MAIHIMRAAACAIGICVVAAGASGAQDLSPPPVRTNFDRAKDVTVLAIAPDGTWGVATEPSMGQAIGRAIADCKRKYRHAIGCGYRSASIREGWLFVMRCGRENILAAGKTLQVAEQAAVDSEFGLRRDYRPDMPPCVRVVSVGPDGGIIAPDTAQLLRLVMNRRQ